MKEQKNNGRGIFYGVIGVATLVVAIIGATFAYFTATATNNTAITGNMATVSFGLDVHKVTKVDEEKKGMIPMSNGMVEAALTNRSDLSSENKDHKICEDDNGNAVCQIYKISITNKGTASMLLDGYVSLTNGSGVATDYTDWVNAKTAVEPDTKPGTSMRWAQVFCTGTDDELKSCTTVGTTTTRATGDGLTAWSAISSTTSGANTEQILKGASNTVVPTVASFTTTGTIAGSQYDIINKNFIRVSDHDAAATGYSRTVDGTSALVFNQQISPKSGEGTTIATNDDSNGIGGKTAYTDAQVYYIVVWLSETGTNQTAGATSDGSTALDNVPAEPNNFFKGSVTFISAQGSEVTATFNGYSRVPSQQ